MQSGGLGALLEALKPLAREEKYESLADSGQWFIAGLHHARVVGGLADRLRRGRRVVRRSQNEVGGTRLCLLEILVLPITADLRHGCVWIVILSVLRQFLDHPKTLLDLLGKALPGMGSYFLQLVIAKVLFSLAFELARPTALIGVVARQGVTRSKYFKVPARVRRRLRRPPEFDYGSYLPDFVLVVLVGTIFAPIAPVVALVCFAYFAVAVKVYSHQFFYVYVRAYETGGAFSGTYISSVLLPGVGRGSLDADWSSDTARCDASGGGLGASGVVHVAVSLGCATHF